jgi:hypothetical protein
LCFFNAPNHLRELVRQKARRTLPSPNGGASEENETDILAAVFMTGRKLLFLTCEVPCSMVAEAQTRGLNWHCPGLNSN